MPRWTESQLRDVVAASDSFADVLRHFGLRTAGGNHASVRNWIEHWGISTEHFTSGAARSVGRGREALPLAQVLVTGSGYQRGRLKQRLYDAGLKRPACELCGQDEEWHGARMSLILDHVNGVFDDNRLENLRIVCPNCNATLPTHCGRNLPPVLEPRACGVCGGRFRPKRGSQRYCSRACGQRYPRAGQARPGARRVDRPPHEQLLEELATSSWSAVGRRYGVSDNAVRKWVRTEERRGAA